MSRLSKRVEKLGGGVPQGVDIIAKVPDWWSSERQKAEVETIARQHGVEPPFGTVVYLRQFAFGIENRDDIGAKIIFMGRAGVDQHFETPLTRNSGVNVDYPPVSEPSATPS